MISTQVTKEKKRVHYGGKRALAITKKYKKYKRGRLGAAAIDMKQRMRYGGYISR